MSNWAFRFLMLTVFIITGTWLFGWWVVPILTSAYGARLPRARGTVLTATCAAILGWGALLAYDAASGSLGRLLAVISGMIRLPGAALVLLTLAYAGLLAASAASAARHARLLISPE
jgi:hypothetical protein